MLQFLFLKSLFIVFFIFVCSKSHFPEDPIFMRRYKIEGNQDFSKYPIRRKHLIVEKCIFYHFKDLEKTVYEDFFRQFYNIRSMEILQSKILYVPEFLSDLPRLKKVYINDSGVKKIRKGAFNGTNLTKLEVTINELTDIEDILLGLKNLTHVSFADNNIGYITRDTFSGNPNIMILKLNKNKLKSLENQFDSNTGLTELVLAKNFLSEISPKTFAHLPVLEALDISTNLLSDVKPLVEIAQLPNKINYMNIRGNPINCCSQSQHLYHLMDIVQDFFFTCDHFDTIVEDYEGLGNSCFNCSANQFLDPTFGCMNCTVQKTCKQSEKQCIMNSRESKCKPHRCVEGLVTGKTGKCEVCPKGSLYFSAQNKLFKQCVPCADMQGYDLNTTGHCVESVHTAKDNKIVIIIVSSTVGIAVVFIMLILGGVYWYKKHRPKEDLLHGMTPEEFLQVERIHIVSDAEYKVQSEYAASRKNSIISQNKCSTDYIDVEVKRETFLSSSGVIYDPSSCTATTSLVRLPSLCTSATNLTRHASLCTATTSLSRQHSTISKRSITSRKTNGSLYISSDCLHGQSNIHLDENSYAVPHELDQHYRVGNDAKGTIKLQPDQAASTTVSNGNIQEEYDCIHEVIQEDDET